jgi:group I intron endonuclease
MYGIIYRATNKRNGKIYIGQTRFSLEKRIREHEESSARKKMAIGLALEKYGKKVFEWQTIDQADTKANLDEKERMWIAFYRSNDPKHGYNLTNGGEGFQSLTDEIKKKISATLRGHSVSQETRKKISQNVKGKTSHPGWKHTIEAKKKMAAHQFSEEHIKNLTIAQRRRQAKRKAKELAEQVEEKSYAV